MSVSLHYMSTMLCDYTNIRMWGFLKFNIVYVCVGLCAHSIGVQGIRYRCLEPEPTKTQTLQKQYVLLTTEPSLQPQICSFWF